MIKTETKVETSSTEHVEMIQGHVYAGDAHMSVYSFAIDGLIIDTGSQTLLNDFKEWFAKQPTSRVIVTHHHEDHTAGASWLQNELKKTIYIHKDSIEIASEEEKIPFYRQALWGEREPFHAMEMPAEFRGERYNWEAIATPGHASDHYTLYCKDLKIMFTGDLYVIPRTKVILSNENMHDMVHSLKRLLTYDFQEIYCCHAGYVENGREMIEMKLAYLEGILARCKELQSEGLTIEEISNTIFPKRYPIEDISEGQWGSIHIVRSFIEDRATIE